MKPDTLLRLRKVSEARYLSEHEKIRPILADEARISSQLVQLDEQAAQASRQSGQSPGFRAAGAEVAWRRWEGQARRQLNAEHARVLAHKLMAVEQLKAAFCRKEAMRGLSKQANRAAADTRKRRALEYLAHETMLRRLNKGS